MKVVDLVREYGPEASIEAILPVLLRESPVIQQARAEGRDYLKGHEVCRHLGISPKALRTVRDRQVLPAIPAGGEYRYPIPGLLEWEWRQNGRAVPHRGRSREEDEFVLEDPLLESPVAAKYGPRPPKGLVHLREVAQS